MSVSPQLTDRLSPAAVLPVRVCRSSPALLLMVDVHCSGPRVLELSTTGPFAPRAKVVIPPATAGPTKPAPSVREACSRRSSSRPYVVSPGQVVRPASRCPLMTSKVTASPEG